jgi:hypothetical protein
MLLIPPEGPTVGSETEKCFQYLAGANDTDIQLAAIGGKEAIADRSILKMRYLLDQG